MATRKKTTKKTAQRTAHATAARDATMARLGACRAALSAATSQLDEVMGLFLVPEDDTKGKIRTDLIEAIDDNIGEAAASVQQAMEAWGDVDPAEGEPETDDEDDDEDDEGEDLDEDDESDEDD